MENGERKGERGSKPKPKPQEQVTVMAIELDRQRQAYVTALERAPDDLVDQLAAMPEVERGILFGSYATGRRLG